MVGSEALSEEDHQFLRFSEGFEGKFLKQGAYESECLRPVYPLLCCGFAHALPAVITLLEYVTSALRLLFFAYCSNSTILNHQLLAQPFLIATRPSRHPPPHCSSVQTAPCSSRWTSRGACCAASPRRR